MSSRWCRCGHRKPEHDRSGVCRAIVLTSVAKARTFCPCAKFTPKGSAATARAEGRVVVAQAVLR